MSRGSFPSLKNQLGLLGFVEKIADPADIFGRRKAKASQRAAQQQAEAVDRATEFQREALATARADLEPFRRFGQSQFDPITSLLSEQQELATDPNAQREFIQDNPFFDALADETQQRLFQNQAARGKLGSGETAKALQNSILLLGDQLLNSQLNRSQQVFSNRFGITQLGGNAAAQQGNVGLTGGTNLADLATQRGNAVASGTVGAANAKAQGANRAIDIGKSIATIYALSDVRYKKDITPIGHFKSGAPAYLFRYTEGEDYYIGTIAQDVEEIIPGSVLEIEGVKYVDYEKILCQ